MKTAVPNSRRLAVLSCWTLALAGLTLAPAFALDFVGWRTDASGHYPDATPPLSWSAEENVIWATPMPDWSNSTPILVGDRLFVCSERSTLLCLRLSDGEILWQDSVAAEDLVTPEQAEEISRLQTRADALRAEWNRINGEINQQRRLLQDDPDSEEIQQKIESLREEIRPVQEELAPLDQSWWRLPATHEWTGYASPTPISDGEHVWVAYGTGLAAAYDLEGHRLWARFVDKPGHGWGHSASPILAGGRLILHYGRLNALDPLTGEDLWQTPSGASFGTPALTTVGGTEVVITGSGDIVRVSDGEKLLATGARVTYSAPVVHGDRVYFIDCEAGSRALRLAGDAGAVTAEVVWETPRRDNRFYASPLIHEGLVYTSTLDGTLTVLSADTGETVYEQKLSLGDTVFASLTRAGEHLFVTSDNGKTVIFLPGREYHEVARTTLEPMRSCLVFAGDRLYIRGSRHMFCLGAP